MRQAFGEGDSIRNVEDLELSDLYTGVRVDYLFELR